MKENTPTSTTPPSALALNARREAITQSVRDHGAFILSYFRSKVKDLHTAKDLWQKFWLDVYRYQPLADITNLVRLRHRAYQTFVHHYRQQKVRNFIEYREEVPDRVDEPAERMPHTLAEEEQFNRRFWEQFPGAQITEDQKKVFFLKHRAGYTLEEIAQMMNLSVAMVFRWIELVKAECREHYNP